MHLLTGTGQVRRGRRGRSAVPLSADSALLGCIGLNLGLDAAARHSLLVGRPPRGQPDSGTTVCAFFNIGLNTIVEAIRAQGLASVETIGAALQAGTNCGTCLPELARILEKEAARRIA